MAAKRYLEHAEPEPVPFYGYAMLTRFTAKHSQVLPCEFQFQSKETNTPRVFAAALRSPQGHLTLILDNRESAALETRIRWEGLARKTTFHRYEVTEDKLKQPGFKLATQARQIVSARQPEFTHALPGRSLTVFTTYDLAPDAPGVIAEKDNP
jgi:hypothetical protein